MKNITRTLFAACCMMALSTGAQAQLGGLLSTPLGRQQQMTPEQQAQAGTILQQMQQEAAKQEALRHQIRLETQQKIRDMMNETYMNREKSADKATNAFDSYIRGDVPAASLRLYTYEEYLKFPVFTYTVTHVSDIAWMYAPQGEQASRAGASGPDAVPWLSLRGWGSQMSLGGIQGSLGGLYPLLADIYSPGRERNPLNAEEMARISSRAGTYVPGSVDQLNGIMLDPALRQAIVDGSLFNLVHGQPIQVVQLPTTSSGGFSNVALILPLSFRIFDNAVEDGDNVTLTIFDTTGQRYTNTFNLTNAGQVISPTVIAGQVELRLLANNQGSSGLNTGQIDILSNVTSGTTSQNFLLNTGQTGSMIISAAP